MFFRLFLTIILASSFQGLFSSFVSWLLICRNSKQLIMSTVKRFTGPNLKVCLAQALLEKCTKWRTSRPAFSAQPKRYISTLCKSVAFRGGKAAAKKRKWKLLPFSVELLKAGAVPALILCWNLFVTSSRSSQRSSPWWHQTQNLAGCECNSLPGKDHSCAAAKIACGGDLSCFLAWQKSFVQFVKGSDITNNRSFFNLIVESWQFDLLPSFTI